jgi:hypothetical protein
MGLNLIMDSRYQAGILKVSEMLHEWALEVFLNQYTKCGRKSLLDADSVNVN